MDFFPEKKLGFGLMRLPLLNADDPASVDLATLSSMVDRFLADGFTYFDTAWMYHNFQSENFIRQALTERYPRESYTLTDKLHVDFLNSKEDRDAVFNEQRKKTGVAYFDYYLLHALTAARYEKAESLDCFSWLAEKKAQGLIRHVGFSFHDTADVLDRILTEHPEMEFVQLQLNYLDWENPHVQSRLCYEVACRHGKSVIVMEPVKGGVLARLPQQAKHLLLAEETSLSLPSWAIRFAASLENVMIVLSGMSSLAQMEDNLSYMKDFRPLTKAETALVHKVADIVRAGVAVPCTACSYCTTGCPQKINIPQCFSLYNDDLQDYDGDDRIPQAEGFARMLQKFGDPADCIACGQCEGICPQHIRIIDELKKVVGHFEK